MVAQTLTATALRWTTDEFPWLRADYDGQFVFLRLNVAFPDEAAYSLLVDEDVTVKPGSTVGLQ